MFKHIFFGYGLLAMSLLTSAFAERLDSEMDLYEYEADEELEKVEESSLSTVFRDFRAKGGTAYRLSSVAEPFALQPGDLIFPSCSAGHNRSQTLWNLLRPYGDKITLQSPHATRYGFDPYDGLPNWQYRDVRANDEFFMWAGVGKSAKFGFELFEPFAPKAEEVTVETLAMLRRYYDTHYYNISYSHARRIYITFAKKCSRAFSSTVSNERFFNQCSGAFFPNC